MPRAGLPECRGRLAVDGDVADPQGVADGGEPGQQAALQGQRVEAVEDALEGVVGRHAVGQVEEAGQPVAAALGEGLDLLPGVGAGDDGAQGDDDDVEQAVALAVLASWVAEGRSGAGWRGGTGTCFCSVKGNGLIASQSYGCPLDEIKFRATIWATRDAYLLMPIACRRRRKRRTSPC